MITSLSKSGEEVAWVGEVVQVVQVKKEANPLNTYGTKEPGWVSTWQRDEASFTLPFLLPLSEWTEVGWIPQVGPGITGVHSAWYRLWIHG